MEEERRASRPTGSKVAKLNWEMAVIALLVIGVATKASRRGAKPSTPAIRWTDSEMATFIEQVAPIGVPLEAALKVYAAESGLDPHASSGIAWGLCQAIGSTLKALGWQRAAKEFGTLSVAQQAPWIAKLLAYQARAIGFVPDNAIDLYVANFSPLAAKMHANVLYREGTQAYAKNRGLDHGAKGYIDRGDLALALGKAESSDAYKNAVAQLRRLTMTRKAGHA